MPGKYPFTLEKCPENAYLRWKIPRKMSGNEHLCLENTHLTGEVDCDFIGAGGSTIKFQDKGRLPQ